MKLTRLVKRGSVPLNIKREAGFTIVELLVTIIVAGIFVGSLALIVNNQVHLSERARDLTVANAFIENKIESLRSAGFLTLANGTSDISSELPTELNAPRGGAMSISPASVSVKRIFIVVSYNDQGSQRTFSYTTFIGELGVGQY